MAMPTNLLDLVKGYITPDIVDKAASYVGESGPATQKAFAGILPTILAALMNQGSTPGGVQQIAQMLDSGRYDGGMLSSLGSLFGGGASTQDVLGAGKGILESLFGSKLGGVTDLIARSSGVRPSSASSLMALATPLIMHVLGRQRAQAGGTTSALTALLGEQKGFLSGLLPAGLGALLGWPSLTSGLSEFGSTAAGAASRVTREVAEVPSKRPGWLIPLGAVAALILAWLLYLWSAAPVTQVTREATRKLAELQL